MRRSTRVKKPVVIVDDDDDLVVSEFEPEEQVQASDDEFVDERPVKKRKVSTSPRKTKMKEAKTKEKTVQRVGRTRAKQGALKNFVEMPLDILYEIAKNFNPLDLVFLTRTSKDLRKTFLNRSAVGVWKGALSNVEGLPECPPHLSEPCYSALLFDTHCRASGCDAKMSRICWELRTRWCQKCILHNSSLGLIRRKYLRRSEIEQGEVLNLCPQTELSFYGQFACTIILFPENLLRNKLIPEFKRMKPNQKDEWVKKQIKIMKPIREHAEKCEKWFMNRENELFHKKEAVRQERVQEILKRLKDLGWEQDIVRFELHRHRLVSQARKLTENTWAKIYPKIVTDIKVERELRARWSSGPSIQRYPAYYAAQFAVGSPVVNGNVSAQNTEAHGDT